MYTSRNVHLFLINPGARQSFEASIRASYAYHMQSAILLALEAPEEERDSFIDEMQIVFGIGLDLHVEWITETNFMDVAKRITDVVMEQQRAGNTVLINVCDNDPLLIVPGYITASLTGSTIIFTGVAAKQENSELPVQIPLIPVCKPLKARLSILAAIQDGVESQDEILKRLEKIPEAPTLKRSGLSHHVKILEKKGFIQTVKEEGKREKKVSLTDMGRLMYDVYGKSS